MLGIIFCQLGWLLWLQTDFANWVAKTNKGFSHFVRILFIYASSWLFWDFIAIESRVLLYSVFTAICGLCWLWAYTKGQLSILLQWLLNICLLMPLVIPQSVMPLTYPSANISGLNIRLDWQLNLFLLCCLNYRLPPIWLKNNLKIGIKQVLSLGLFCSGFIILTGQLLGLWNLGLATPGLQIWWLVLYASLGIEVFLRRVLQIWLDQGTNTTSQILVCAVVFTTLLIFSIPTFGTQHGLLLSLLSTCSTWIFLQNQSILSGWLFHAGVSVFCWLFLGKLLYLV